MKHFLLILCAVLSVAACSQKTKPASTYQRPASAEGDSTIYGLVCDGSNDTILVFLNDPYDGADPDTLDILEASKAGQVFGFLRIGDRVAVIRDSADEAKASLVIVTQDLMGDWCYKVKPSLRRLAGMEHLDSATIVAHLPDSLRALFEEEREYGFTLKIDSLCFPVGIRNRRHSSDEESPLVYPEQKRYRQWYIRNGKMMFVEARTDSLGNRLPTTIDTTELVRLTPDTLVLRFSDGERGFYKKTEEASE